VCAVRQHAELGIWNPMPDLIRTTGMSRLVAISTDHQRWHADIAEPVAYVPAHHAAHQANRPFLASTGTRGLREFVEGVLITVDEPGRGDTRGGDLNRLGLDSGDRFVEGLEAVRKIGRG